MTGTIAFEDLDDETKKKVKTRLGADVTLTTSPPLRLPETFVLAAGGRLPGVRRRYKYTESRIQQAYITRVRGDARTKGIVIAAIPNGARRSKQQGGILKAEGLLAGYPDVIVEAARGGYHGLRIEFKAPGGSISFEQGRVTTQLMASGYLVYFTEDADDAFDLTLDYLAGKYTFKGDR